MSNIIMEYNKSQSLGDIITIIKNGIPVGRLRQVGKHAPNADVRLEWLEWQDTNSIEHAIQFPMCGLADITQGEVEEMVAKYNL